MPTKQNKIKNDIQILNSLLNDIDWHTKIKEIELLIKNLDKIIAPPILTLQSQILSTLYHPILFDQMGFR